MLVNKIRQEVRADLESPTERRQWGSGWISGVLAWLMAFAGLFFVLCLRFPKYFTLEAARPYYDHPYFRLALHLLLISAFALAIISLVLRTTKALGFVAIGVVLLATVLGGSRVPPTGELVKGNYLGLDWFVLNVALTGLLFVPLERLFSHRPEQNLFRDEWREDLFYYFVSSMMVQVLTFISMAPVLAILSHTSWTSFREWISAQPLVLQVIEIMFFTDLVQYWVHRAFHRVPFLWGFHAVHHSAQSLDWLAAARMHFLEIIVLRGTTVIPMFILGFSQMSLHAYILIIYVHSGLLHANVRWEFNRIGKFLATPRFHHWHHGVEKEAIDVNFAIHFPLLDRLFGTYHLPPGEWPVGYGIDGHPVPRSYIKQFLYPFVRKAPEQPPTVGRDGANA